MKFALEFFSVTLASILFVAALPATAQQPEHPHPIASFDAEHQRILNAVENLRAGLPLPKIVEYQFDLSRCAQNTVENSVLIPSIALLATVNGVPEGYQFEYECNGFAKNPRITEPRHIKLYTLRDPGLNLPALGNVVAVNVQVYNPANGDRVFVSQIDFLNANGETTCDIFNTAGIVCPAGALAASDIADDFDVIEASSRRPLAVLRGDLFNGLGRLWTR